MIKNKYWLARQTWEDLLFLHWTVDPEILKPFIPAPLELDTFDGKAWVGVVSYSATHNEARKMRSIFSMKPFLELNVRTYVTYKGDSGVFFITLDADSLLAVRGARLIAGLPYFYADMTLNKNDRILYKSMRTHKNEPRAGFQCAYEPVSKPFFSEPGTLEYFLTERYSLWKSRNGKAIKGPIDHEPWDLQSASAEIYKNELLDFLPADSLGEGPIAHYCREKTVFFFRFERP
ncbi:YqjF family protein [Alkalicoccus halolimnae]|uniref:DUF2071 domain-containing protein n=1 Tax=Alkalicoccus halolimnae TaxID=1667239 RepID=A0A5C7FIK4_9BACI|nr:DUF2071 domain-containing protein [Alkalicoccus halolimnae]TXF86124.1 DUF2071 domain-containing protein [Alkalicoccus halolimnae]